MFGTTITSVLALAAPLQVADLAASRATPTATAGPQSGPFAETRVQVARGSTVLALRDMTGDGKLELLRIDRGGVLLRRLEASGSFEEAGSLLRWPARDVGWDIADLDGDGRSEVVMVADGKRVAVIGFDGGSGWTEPRTLFDVATYLPAGVARVPFARDVNGDGRTDLVLPGPGRYHIRLNGGEDAAAALGVGWGAPVEVAYEPNIEYELGDPTRLSSTFGQRVRVPWFSMEDVDGDGTQDLVSESSDRVAFHLARPQIDANPTWELDLSALKNDVSSSDIDLDDLLSAVSGFAQWRVDDLDGKGAKDLIIGSEGKFRIFLGGAAAGPDDTPDQVLKLSGNVLYYFVRDVVGDERPDLQIVRGERVSLARLLKYLVVPGQLDFDVFTYANEGGTFSRRPTKRTTIGLRVPRLLKLFEEMEELSDELEEQWDIPARRLDWHGDGEENDIIDEVKGQMRIYADCAPPPHKFENLSIVDGIDSLVERVVLHDLDDLEDGGVNIIDLGSLETLAAAPGKTLREATNGKQPVATMPLWKGEDDREFRTRDIDGDGRLDIVTVIEANGTYQVQLFVRR